VLTRRQPSRGSIGFAWVRTGGTDISEIHYTRSGDVAIAYQVVGEGTFDLVFVPTFANLVFPWLNRD
jgi:hypothetical protein